MVFPTSNLPTASVPWGREVEKQLSAATITIKSNELNNAARDNQLAASLTRVNAAASAAQASIDAIGNLDQATSTYKINAANVTVGTLTGITIRGNTIETAETGSRVKMDSAGLRAFNSSGNEVLNFKTSDSSFTVTGGAITGGSITGANINTSASGTRVQLSGDRINFFDSNNNLVGRVLAGSNSMSMIATAGGGIVFLDNGGVSVSGFMFVAGASFTSISNQGSYTSNGSITIDGSLTRTAMSGGATRYAYVTSAGAIIAGANTPSDIRLKENISTTSLGLNYIKSVNPVEFEFINKQNPHNQGTQFGVIAQELVQALESNGITGDNGIVYIPEIAENDGGSDGYYLVNHEQLISPLIKAIQELSAKVEVLENN
jgi:hypothetical protein